MSRQLRLTKFRELSLDDPFFESLKQGYEEFPDWFSRKADEDLYVVDDGAELSGMIYLKREEGPVTDVEPNLPARVWLKVGTLKIVGRGTKLGERVIKKIFDTALQMGAEGIYVTVFELHASLLALFEKYGFKQEGTKTTNNGVELVMVRSLTDFSGDILRDYPFVHRSGRKAWLLAIKPEYHTELLPDSILRNEPREIIQDVSHTNTIHKVYISGLALQRMSRGDALVFYRTSDKQSAAYFRSVVTSVCVVEEVKTKKDFSSIESFLEYTRPRSVFDEETLRAWYGKGRMSVAKLTYNAAFGKRITRGNLLEAGLVSEQPRWDLRALSEDQFQNILQMGQVNARLIVD